MQQIPLFEIVTADFRLARVMPLNKMDAFNFNLKLYSVGILMKLSGIEKNAL